LVPQDSAGVESKKGNWSGNNTHTKSHKNHKNVKGKDHFDRKTTITEDWISEAKDMRRWSMRNLPNKRIKGRGGKHRLKNGSATGWLNAGGNNSRPYHRECKGSIGGRKDRGGEDKLQPNHELERVRMT